MIRSYFLAQIPLLIIYGVAGFLIPRAHVVDIFFGYLISFVFVFVSVVALERTWKLNDNTFMNVFWGTLFARFVGIIIVLIIIYGATKIDEIYFTVSFIISYLCHSITEIIFINKILEKGSNTV
ncbi:MAG: hypothetical protein JJ895_07575 [Balneolaceae bacterium]|nr:hypothetical protein [Balneolaceae bacterium]